MLQNMKGFQHTSEVRNRRRLSSRNTAAGTKTAGRGSSGRAQEQHVPGTGWAATDDLKCALLPPSAAQ